MVPGLSGRVARYAKSHPTLVQLFRGGAPKERHADTGTAQQSSEREMERPTQVLFVTGHV